MDEDYVPSYEEYDYENYDYTNLTDYIGNPNIRVTGCLFVCVSICLCVPKTFANH